MLPPFSSSGCSDAAITVLWTNSYPGLKSSTLPNLQVFFTCLCWFDLSTLSTTPSSLAYFLSRSLVFPSLLYVLLLRFCCLLFFLDLCPLSFLCCTCAPDVHIGTCSVSTKWASHRNRTLALYPWNLLLQPHSCLSVSGITVFPFCWAKFLEVAFFPFLPPPTQSVS